MTHVPLRLQIDLKKSPIQSVSITLQQVAKRKRIVHSYVIQEEEQREVVSSKSYLYSDNEKKSQNLQMNKPKHNRY